MTWPVYQLVAQGDADALRARLVADGYVLRTLDGAGLRDAGGLWVRAGNAFGQPAAGGWDSFADLMFNAVMPDDDEGDKVAVVWEHADSLVQASLGTFLEAFDVLVSLVRSAYEKELDVTVCFLGDGPGYAPASEVG